MADLSFAPDCVVIHEITNTVKHLPPDKCVSDLMQVVHHFASRYPNTKFIVSLGIPRVDSAELDFKIEMVNVLLRNAIKHDNVANITFCDNSNFTRNGHVQSHLLSSDGYHLSDEGTRVLCSNIRGKTEVVLGIRDNGRHRYGRYT